MKVIFIITAMVLLTGCAVTSYKFQFQKRMDNFYNILNKEELADFQKDDLDAFSNSMNTRLSNNQKLSTELSVIQDNEAINTFNSYQTAHFFRETILRELNRDNYYRFINYISSNGQEAFVRGSDFQVIFDNMYSGNGSFRSFIDNLRTEYRLRGFSNPQIVYFFRNTSFPEASRKQLYYLLKLLNEVNAYKDFMNGNIKAAASELDQGAGDSHPIQGDELDNIRKLSGLTAVSSSVMLDLYSSIIMKEMDPYALSRTIETIEK